MAIPVFLRDTFYLIENTTSEEIFKILKEEGINSATLRGKATMQFPAASFEAIKSVIKSSLSSAQIAFYQAGDGFFAMPISDVETLNYYKTEDGKLYASVQDYHMSKLSQDSVVHNPAVASIPNPVVSEKKVVSPVLSVDTAEEKKEEVTVEAPVVKTPVRVKVRVKEEPKVQVAPVIEEADSVAGENESVDEVVEEAAGEVKKEVVQPVVENEPEYVEEYTPEQKIFLENADFLDKVLSNGTYKKIADHLLLHLDDVKRLMDVLGEEFEQEIKIPTLTEGNMLDFVTGVLPEGKFKNEVGESNQLTDAMIMLPVFSALLGKKKKSLQTKFSVANLVGSKLARVSVAGISENGALCGFVHFETITNEAVAEAKKNVEAHLAETGRDFNELTSQEKYDLYLAEINNYYIAHKDCGKMLAAPGSNSYVELNKALSEMDNEKFSVPEFYNPDEGMITWARHETIAFDNRGEKTLLEQAHELVKPERVLVSAQPIVTPVIANPIISSVELTEEEIVLPNNAGIEATNGIGVANVIALPSSFEEDTDELESAEQLTGGLSDSEIENLLDALVQNSKPAPVKPVVRGVVAGEQVIEGSINFSGLPSLTNPIAYKDEQGHVWESKEVYDKAMASIGLSGDLLGNTPLTLGDEEEVRVKGK